MVCWCAQLFIIIFNENHIVQIKNKASVGKVYLIICAILTSFKLNNNCFTAYKQWAR